MTLLLIRHGPTVWNQDRRLQGRADIPLSSAGRGVVSGWRIPRRFLGLPSRTSPLSRAVETAALLNLAPAVEPSLHEIDWGAWEGRRLADLRLSDPSEVKKREAQGLDFRAPGGESYREAAKRVAPFLDLDAILVVHRGLMLAALAVRTGWTMDRPAPVQFDHADAILIEDAAISVVPLAPSSDHR